MEEVPIVVGHERRAHQTKRKKKKGESLLAGGSSNDQVSTAILPHVVCVPSV